MALTDRHNQFVDEYMVARSAPQAAIRAGQSAWTAHQQASQLVQCALVRGEIQAAVAPRAECPEISQAWVVERLVANATRAMQAVPVVDRDGNPTGRYNYQGSVANRALELLGKHIGLWAERHDDKLPKRLDEMDSEEIRHLLGDSYVAGQHAEEDHLPAGEPPTRKLN